MKIVIKNQKVKTPKILIDACNGNEVLARVFFNRGISTIKDFNNCTKYDEYIPYDPSIFPGMEKACEIIKESIEKKEKIAVYGDYDVDGVTATTILVSALSSFGAEVSYHVPDRFSEGYGMNLGVVEEMSKQGISTIVTCDCGISNFEEIKLAKSLGMKVVLTDHHTIGDEIPCADVVINPKLLPDDHKARSVSGCCVAYFLAESLAKYLGKEIEDFTDLVALSTIADVIPLRDESRYLFHLGYEKLINGERLGMGELINLIGSSSLSGDDIGFQIAPRINAVGRMATAKIAVELFLCNDKEKAHELALEIDRYNSDRKNIQKQIFEQAKEQVETEKMNKKVLVLHGEDWHHGIIGIVAGKICEQYRKPCIILSLSDDGESYVGSARSDERLNLYETLSKFSDDLIKFGGHAQAAGLSLKRSNLEKFTKDIETYADLYIDGDYEENIAVDMVLPFSMVNEDLLEVLKKGEPYGAEFEPPKFVVTDAKIQKDTINQGKHHFITLVDGSNKSIGSTLWNYGPESIQGKECAVIFDIFKDMYMERNEIKIKIQEILFEKIEITDSLAEWIDRRNVPIEEVVKEFKGSTIFYEGPKIFKPDLPTSGYDFDEKVSTLILYSLPKSNMMLKRLVEKSCADKIVINYSYLPKYDINTFAKMFLGIIKNTVENYDGITSATRIAKSMQIDEEFVETFCEFLSSKGMIDFEILTDGEILFKIKQGKTKENLFLEKTIFKYLKEKEEYVKYMMRSSVSE